jgi:hypothetical protein
VGVAHECGRVVRAGEVACKADARVYMSSRRSYHAVRGPSAVCASIVADSTGSSPEAQPPTDSSSRVCQEGYSGFALMNGLVLKRIQ